MLVTQGLGLGLGAKLFFAWVVMNTTDGVPDWYNIWLYPAPVRGGVMVIFFLFFWDSADKPTPSGVAQRTGEQAVVQSPHAAFDRRIQSAARVGHLWPRDCAHRVAPLARGAVGVSRRVARTGRACAHHHRVRRRGAPPGLPQSYPYEGITVQFARDPGNADELLERIIAAHDTPRKLVVVSGDHRVQRAARRRRATAVDSDRWWADLCAERRRKGAELPMPPQKPTGNLSAGEVDYWVSQFSDAPPEDSPQTARTRAPADDLDNPFPPGYGEDLLNDE